MDLKGRDFLKLLDFTPEEIEYLLDLAADLKDKREKRNPRRYPPRQECGSDLREDQYPYQMCF